MGIVKYRKIFYLISSVLIILSITSIIIWDFNLGIDFKGGTAIEVGYEKRPDIFVVEKSISHLYFDQTIRPVGDNNFIIKTKALGENERQQISDVIERNGGAIKQVSTIGPSLGIETAKKSVTSVVLVLLCIVLFITFAFRKVSKPISSWKYGLITVVALLHDVIVPIGIFSLFGHFYGWEIDALFVTALLVILGFSVHDTIVVFDRVRENLKHNHENKEKKEFHQIVGESIKQTFARSINTSLTTLIALIVLYFMGGEVTRLFSLTLIIGIITGTYSSIFIASPLLVTLKKFQDKE